MENGIKNGRGSIADEGKLARRHLVEDGAKREQIGACVKILPKGLLGRHVSHRPKGCARASQELWIGSQGRLSGNIDGARLQPSGRHLGEAKIQDLGLTPLRYET